MQGCTPEWRTKFQREATTRKRENTVIRDPRILCTPLSKFLDPPLLMSSFRGRIVSSENTPRGRRKQFTKRFAI